MDPPPHIVLDPPEPDAVEDELCRHEKGRLIRRDLMLWLGPIFVLPPFGYLTLLLAMGFGPPVIAAGLPLVAGGLGYAAYLRGHLDCRRRGKIPGEEKSGFADAVASYFVLEMGLAGGLSFLLLRAFLKSLPTCLLQ